MKFALRHLIVVTLFSALFLAGCEDDTRLRQAQTEREQMVSTVSSNVNEINQSILRLQEQQKTLEATLSKQDMALQDLAFNIRNLQGELETQSGAIAAERAAADQEAGRVGPWGWIIAIIIIILIVYVVYRLVRPKPFEEDEDEDFSSFDEDFGFDEDEEFGDEEKKTREDEDKSV